MKKLIISFSGRESGNCDQIARYIASDSDTVVFFRELNVHPCSGCGYECFESECIYRADDIYGLYKSMCDYDKVILIVPMYCGNPASLYYIFNERGQDYFLHNETYEKIINRLYIIGVYGKAETSPEFILALEKWFEEYPCKNRVLGIERHKYALKLCDNVLNIAEVRTEIDAFLSNMT